MKPVSFLKNLGLAALFLSSGLSYGAEKGGFELDLKSNKPASERSLGEFNLSLDSQIFQEKTLADSITTSRAPDDVPRAGGFVLDTQASQEPPSPPPAQKPISAATAPIPDWNARVSPTLTFSGSFSQPALTKASVVPNGVGAQKQVGRWHLYGEYGHADTTYIPSSLNPAPTYSSKISASRVRTDDLPRAGFAPVPGGNLPELSIPSVDNYYLEAIYNFNPTLTGRFSYQRSQFETLQRKEDLKVEGSVDASRNVTIKAGFSNKSGPDTGERKVVPEKNVFTEFILKF